MTVGIISAQYLMITLRVFFKHNSQIIADDVVFNIFLICLVSSNMFSQVLSSFKEICHFTSSIFHSVINNKAFQTH